MSTGSWINLTALLVLAYLLLNSGEHEAGLSPEKACGSRHPCPALQE